MRHRVRDMYIYHSNTFQLTCLPRAAEIYSSPPAVTCDRTVIITGSRKVRLKWINVYFGPCRYLWSINTRHDITKYIYHSKHQKNHSTRWYRQRHLLCSKYTKHRGVPTPRLLHRVSPYAIPLSITCIVVSAFEYRSVSALDYHIYPPSLKMVRWYLAAVIFT